MQKKASHRLFINMDGSVLQGGLAPSSVRIWVSLPKRQFGKRLSLTGDVKRNAVATPSPLPLDDPNRATGCISNSTTSPLPDPPCTHRHPSVRYRCVTGSLKGLNGDVFPLWRYETGLAFKTGEGR